MHFGSADTPEQRSETREGGFCGHRPFRSGFNRPRSGAPGVITHGIHAAKLVHLYLTLACIGYPLFASMRSSATLAHRAVSSSTRTWLTTRPSTNSSSTQAI